jgi:pimeloyl-ACP methyl ester carboxylesterase
VELATFLKAGKYTGSVGVPTAVALMGHSFGSILSHGVAAYAPEAIDAVILTAYGLNFSAINFPLILEAWNFRIASIENQTFTGQNLQLDTGYVSWVDLGWLIPPGNGG